MLQASSASNPVAPRVASEAASEIASESVRRPDPGLARGQWEAPAWAFWAALAVVVVGSAVYVLGRMGILRLPSSKVATDVAKGPHVR